MGKYNIFCCLGATSPPLAVQSQLVDCDGEVRQELPRVKRLQAAVSTARTDWMEAASERQRILMGETKGV